MAISTAYWLSAVTVEGDDRAGGLQEVSTTMDQLQHNGVRWRPARGSGVKRIEYFQFSYVEFYAGQSRDNISNHEIHFHTSTVILLRERYGDCIPLCLTREPPYLQLKTSVTAILPAEQSCGTERLAQTLSLHGCMSDTRRYSHVPEYGPVRLLTSHQGEPGLIPDRFTPDFRKWESCRTMPLVSEFSRGSPPPPIISFSPHLTLVGSQDLAATGRIKYILVELHTHDRLRREGWQACAVRGTQDYRTSPPCCPPETGAVLRARTASDQYRPYVRHSPRHPSTLQHQPYLRAFQAQADADNLNALDVDALRRNLLRPDWLPFIATHRTIVEPALPSRSSQQLRVKCGMERRRNARPDKRKIPEKTRKPAASSVRNFGSDLAGYRTRFAKVSNHTIYEADKRGGGGIRRAYNYYNHRRQAQSSPAEMFSATLEGLARDPGVSASDRKIRELVQLTPDCGATVKLYDVTPKPPNGRERQDVMREHKKIKGFGRNMRKTAKDSTGERE
ncbi:hypothetical protein PR048_025882 [Dryococelus australis]|uniref:Uncharacterized protein n=1 Tax=Dryococelus australis TaxID=614101 RepID=A0ABQ9GJS5_9NEOP|nr:hypothetical protein PR048_025882 [Dryococelus australis]